MSTPVNQIMAKLQQLDHLDAHLISFLEQMKQEEADLLKATFETGYKTAQRQRFEGAGFKFPEDYIFTTITHEI